MFAEFLMTAPIMVGAKEICKIPGALKRLFWPFLQYFLNEKNKFPIKKHHVFHQNRVVFILYQNRGGTGTCVSVAPISGHSGI